MIIRIAIIDDDIEFTKQLMGYIKTMDNLNLKFEISTYENPLYFFDSFINQFDITFMDIDMPRMDGLSGAKELRKMDKNVIIIFTTYLAQYTINGYEVNALDFLLKPIKYSQFIIKFKRAISYISRDTGKKILLNVKNQTVVINSSILIYIEIIKHELYFHTTQETFSIRGTLKELNSTLDGFPFVRCNKCYIVNLAKVTRVKGFELYLNENIILQINKSRKKDFMKQLTDFYGNRTFNMGKYI